MISVLAFAPTGQGWRLSWWMADPSHLSLGRGRLPDVGRSGRTEAPEGPPHRHRAAHALRRRGRRGQGATVDDVSLPGSEGNGVRLHGIPPR